MPFSNNPKGMSQVMTIILTTVIATMIAAIIGLSAGDIIPGAFSDTGQQSCIQQIESECQNNEGEEVRQPTSCSGILNDDDPDENEIDPTSIPGVESYDEPDITCQ